MYFPHTRHRRTRMQPWCRELVAEVRLHPSDFILPLFITEGQGVEDPIKTLPGVARLSIDKAILKAKEARDAGIKMLALFPVVDAKLKSDDAKESYNSSNLICRAVRELKLAVPDIGLMADVALDPYTENGHDGIVSEKGEVLNDETVAVLVSQSLALAAAGVDAVAPSDMMDGRVGAIREAFEDEGYHNTMIISYAAKYFSGFYGPFRDAVGSKKKGDSVDKRSYQMDPRNADEAIAEVMADEAEGADMIIVKPGLPYLDIIANLKDEVTLPILAYHVSGECAKLRFAADAGAIDFDRALMETMYAFKRAGCRAIVSYYALEAINVINQ